MDADSSQTSSPSKKERDATVEAVNHLIQGKRHLLVQDFSSAVNSLELACSLLAACYGDLANECGDAYFYYGKALLEFSRRESGVFGNTKDESGGEEDEDDDEEEEEEEENGEDEGEKEESGDESKSSESCAVPGLAKNVNETSETVKEPIEVDGLSRKEGSEAKSEDLEDSKKADEETVAPEPSVKDKATASEENKENEVVLEPIPECSSSKDTGSDEKPSSSTADIDFAQPGPSGEQKPKEGEEDDVTNLQLAWEVLELAKIIFKRQAGDNREMKLRLAQVYSKLGEVAMESENYNQSVEDLEECLKLQLPLLDHDDRQLAETYYQLGLVYTLGQDFESALRGFQMAIDTINSRIENLNKIVANNAPPNENGDDPVFHAKIELAELQELLPELQEKMTDTQDLKKNPVKVSEELKKDFMPVTEELKPETTPSPVKEVKPISNIGHLVRKKRKPEEDSASSSQIEESVSKKVKSDDTHIGKGDEVSSNTIDSHVNGKSKEENINIANVESSNGQCV